MDIPRLDVKGVAVELVNDAIKHAFLTLGYAAATSDQDKAVREFLQGKDVFVALPTGEGKSLSFTTLLALCLTSLNSISQSVLAAGRDGTGFVASTALVILSRDVSDVPYECQAFRLNVPDHLSSPIKSGGLKWTGDETTGASCCD